MTSHTGPILEGRGDTDYERYVRVPELLELQKPKVRLLIDLLREQIIVLETMAPVDDHEFRVGVLGRGSGQNDYDEAFMKWRFTCMRLAFRIIGSKVMSLRGVPAAQLEAGTDEPLFPQLWETISALTGEFKAAC
jgi:tryptophan 2,3-dioxygenase